MQKRTKKREKQTYFASQILAWYSESERPLPWKEEKNPYFIWLSEIILQQTRVEQGLPYFEKFKKAFPKIEDLANASEDQVMKLWQGLGYYSRARNLHYTAQIVAKDYAGKFPDTYEEILALKGVGPYTAAAISSFAFDLPYAAVDGNVYRVLSRYFGESTPIDSSLGKKIFQQLANQLIDEKAPGRYNQALIDFGATHCKPKLPKCTDCLLNSTCVAYKEDAITNYPVKTKKIIKRDRYFNYLLVNFDETILIKKRVEKDIWQNLYEFLLIEGDCLLEQKQLVENEAFSKLFESQKFEIRTVSKPFKHILTHQNIYARFWELDLKKPLKNKPEAFEIIPRESISEYAVPRLIDWYLQDNSLYLKL